MLFQKAKAGEARAKLIQALTIVVQGTQSEHGFALMPRDVADKLNKYQPGVVQVRDNVAPDANGNVQVVATEIGIKGLQENAQEAGSAITGAAQADATPKPKPTFELEGGLTPAEAKRGGIRESIYPFATMNVVPNPGSSFFVGKSADMENPVKTLSSVVSAANRRFAATYPATTGKDKKPHPKAGQSTGKDGRKFTVRPFTFTDGPRKGESGARVYRIA